MKMRKTKGPMINQTILLKCFRKHIVLHTRREGGWAMQSRLERKNVRTLTKQRKFSKCMVHGKQYTISTAAPMRPPRLTNIKRCSSINRAKKTHVNNCLLLWWFWAQYNPRCCACSSCEKRRRKKSLLSGNKNDNDKTWCKFYLTVTVNLPIYFVSLFSTLRCHLTFACFKIRCTRGESSDVRKKLHEMPKHCAQLKKKTLKRVAHKRKMKSKLLLF